MQYANRRVASDLLQSPFSYNIAVHFAPTGNPAIEPNNTAMAQFPFILNKNSIGLRNIKPKNSVKPDSIKILLNIKNGNNDGTIVLTQNNMLAYIESAVIFGFFKINIATQAIAIHK